MKKQMARITQVSSKTFCGSLSRFLENFKLGYGCIAVGQSLGLTITISCKDNTALI
jgi:hypothetical protein